MIDLKKINQRYRHQNDHADHDKKDDHLFNAERWFFLDPVTPEGFMSFAYRGIIMCSFIRHILVYASDIEEF